MKRSDILALITNGIAGSSNTGDRLQSADIDQALRAAVNALEKSRPHFDLASITLVSQQPNYGGLPTGFVDYASSDWGTQTQAYLGRGIGSVRVVPRPKINAIRKGGVYQLWFSRAPTLAQINAWGSNFSFKYYVKHVLVDDETLTTINDNDESLLILRAMAELMRILATRNVVDPVQLHHGIGNVPTSSTPTEMYNSLMLEYRRQATGGGYS